MLKQRIIFGVLFGILFVGWIYLDGYASRAWRGGGGGGDQMVPPGLFVALLSLMVIPLGLREMRGLLAKQNVRISLRITVPAAVLCMLWPWIEQVSESAERNSPWASVGRWFLSRKPHYLVPTVLALALVAAVVKHARKQRVEGAMANAGGTLLAIVYLGVLPGFFLPICMTHSAWMVLAVCGLVKAADIGAFATGKLIGKHKLIPWLSPGKTVEGFIGGLILAGVAGGAVAWLADRRFEGWDGALVAATAGVLLGAVGQVGDLLESLLKRDAGVKDSGSVPGFGGVLDILDSPLLAAPVAYWMLKLMPLAVSAAGAATTMGGTG